MKIKILSDSTCDLSRELLEKYDITLVPLSVIKDGKDFKDGVTITPADIFAHVAAGGALCTTSAVSIGEYADIFEQYAADSDGIIHINLGSGFSTCYQSACLAAEEFDNVFAVDSCNLSSGQGLMVIEAALAAQRGEKAEDIVAMLKELTGRIDTSFVLD